MRKEVLESLVRPVVEHMGYVWVGLEWIGAGFGRSTMRLYIERPGGSSVTVDECGIVSRQVSSVLDVEGGLQEAYYLEVSSPGMNRIFFTVEQMIPFVGAQVKLSLRAGAPGERRQYKGVLMGIGEGGVVRVLVEGEEFSCFFRDIGEVRLVPDFTKALKKTRGAQNDE